MLAATQKTGSVYKLIFNLGKAPAHDLTLRVSVYYLRVLPSEALFTINGRQGVFAIEPQRAPDLESAMSWSPVFSRQTFIISVARSWLRAGKNKIAIAWVGEGAGANYD